jgi:hypothetical protein
MIEDEKDEGPTLDEMMGADAAPGTEAIDLEPPDVDDEPEPEPSRKEKRKQRGKLRKENDELRERAEKLEKEFAEFKEKSEREGRENFLRQVQAAQQQPKPDAGPSPLDKELEGVHAREDALLGKFNALPETERAAKQAEYMSEMRKLTDEATAIQVKKALGGMPKQQPQQSQRDIGNAILASRFPDVFRDKRAEGWGWARYQQKLADGKPDGLDLAAEAMQEAAEHFNLAAPPEAREADKRRHMATSRGGKATPATEQKSFAMTPLWKSMADESHSHIKDPAERYRVWATEIGVNMKNGGA